MGKVEVRLYGMFVLGLWNLKLLLRMGMGIVWIKSSKWLELGIIKGRLDKD